MLIVKKSKYLNLARVERDNLTSYNLSGKVCLSVYRNENSNNSILHLIK